MYNDWNLPLEELSGCGGDTWDGGGCNNDVFPLIFGADNFGEGEYEISRFLSLYITVSPTVS